MTESDLVVQDALKKLETEETEKLKKIVAEANLTPHELKNLEKTIILEKIELEKKLNECTKSINHLGQCETIKHGFHVASEKAQHKAIELEKELTRINKLYKACELSNSTCHANELVMKTKIKDLQKIKQDITFKHDKCVFDNRALNIQAIKDKDYNKLLLWRIGKSITMMLRDNNSKDKPLDERTIKTRISKELHISIETLDDYLVAYSRYTIR